MILLHLVVVHLVWRCCVRVGVRPWLATFATLPLVVLGAGAENLVWAFQIGFLGSLALGLGAALLVDHEAPWNVRDAAAVALAVFSLLWSAVAIVLVVACATIIVLRRGLRDAVVFAALPTLVYLVWWHFYGRTGPYAASSLDEFGAGVWSYAARGLTGAADRFVLDLPLLGSLALAVLAVHLIRTLSRAKTQEALAYVAAAAAVLQFVLSAYGRLKLGPDQAATQRYSYIAIVLILPAATLAVERLARRRAAVLPVTLAVAVAVTTTNLMVLRREAGAEAGRELFLRDVIVAAAAIVSDPRQPLAPGAVPEPSTSFDITVDDLRRWRLEGSLPDLTPAPEAVLTARENLEVALAPSAVRPGTCRLRLAGEEATLGEGGARSAILRGDQGSSIAVRLTDPSTGVSGRPRLLSIRASTSELTILASGVTAQLSSLDRPIEVCNRR
jgi:hypothetical protein